MLKKALILFLLIGFFTSCATNNSKNELQDEFQDLEYYSGTTVETNDTLPPFDITKKKSGGFNVWEISENKNKVNEITGKYYLETCPKGIFDKPISTIKKEQLKNAPITYRDATWSAAYRALNNLIPVKESKIIFDYSKFNRQINKEDECLFFGDCQIKNENGKYVDAVASITVKYIFPEDPREPAGWYCVGNIVF